MPSPGHWWLVNVEFGRVQTYLFAVSELKSMLGANTLLGELLRGRLGATGFAGDPDTPPGLAVTHHAGLPPDVDAGKLPLPDGPRQDDPLGSGDDPRAGCREGVLARDGGHFH